MEEASGTPLVSVVITTHDGGPMLLECLERLRPNRAGVELILVDNASRDGSVEKAAESFPGTCVVSNAVNEGYARACNQGAARARGDFVLFLNNDAFITPDHVANLIEAAAADPAGAVWQPVIVTTEGVVESAGDAFTWWGFFARIQERPDGTDSRPVFAAKGACLLVRRAVFDELGGFRDDYFAYFEESDFCWRARLAGWEVRVVSDATVEHVGGMTSTRLLSPWDIRYLSFRNRLRTILANASGLSLLRIVPLHLLGSGCFVALFLVTGRLRSVAAVLKSVAWPLGNLRTVRSQRRTAQERRVLPDKGVFRRDLVIRVTPAIILSHLRDQMYRWENM
jgi:GT2 family glycosyltransferase